MERTGKEVDLYSAFIEVPYTQGARGREEREGSKGLYRCTRENYIAVYLDTPLHIRTLYY